MESSLPTLNAGLNLTACVFLCLGLYFVKRERLRSHAACMLTATVVSAAFLVSYLIYHFKVIPEVGHTPFRHAGAIRVAYYAMLISHILLAAVNLPLILMTLWWAFRRNWTRHKRIARWTWPIWFYVSITGVVVYVALYHLNPPAG